LARISRARVRGRSRATRSASRPTRSSRLGGASPISFSTVLFRDFPSDVGQQSDPQSDRPAGAACWPPSQRKKERFTALFPHISVDLLRTAFFALKRDAAAGVDGLKWQDYEADLERNLEDLHARVQRGAYRAPPSRRQYISKPDGRQRPLAIAALEDKVAQRATAAVLNGIYEEDFLGFSYGFRPKRGQHDALDALVVGITSKKVNYILDADIVLGIITAKAACRDVPAARPTERQDRQALEPLPSGPRYADAILRRWPISSSHPAQRNSSKVIAPNRSAFFCLGIHAGLPPC
jgi:hypothetical protein